MTQAASPFAAAPFPGQLDAMLGTIKRVIRGALPELRFFGTYEYRCVGVAGTAIMSGTCTDVDAGMPDVTDLAMLPSIVGGVATWPEGSLFYLQFANGKESKPIIVAAGQGIPNTVSLDAAQKVEIGPSSPSVVLAGGGAQVARIGDQVSVFFPPTMAVAGTVGGAPFTGVITVATPALGIIQTGSPKTQSG